MIILVIDIAGSFLLMLVVILYMYQRELYDNYEYFRAEARKYSGMLINLWGEKECDSGNCLHGSVYVPLEKDLWSVRSIDNINMRRLMTKYMLAYHECLSNCRR